MAEFKETVEEIKASEASVSKLFESDERRVRGISKDSGYMSRLVEAVDFIAEVESGKRPMYQLREAMSTSDFPILFADVLDRQMLASYRELSPTYPAYTRQATVPDFRKVERYALDGAEGVLPEVDELEEYPEVALQEAIDEYKVRKYGRRIDLSWEALINDDLDAFRRNPERLARGARRSEERFATTLFVDASGPHASLYNVQNDNIIPGNPAFGLEGLQAAYTKLNELTDEDGEPILIDMAVLVIPPALEVTVNNLLNATMLEISGQGTGGDTTLHTGNWMTGRLQVVVAPYLPYIADEANGGTSWFLFASPGSGRPALEFGKLRGFEDPGLYERIPNSRSIGGGEVPEAFEDDSRAWKVRHVFGGARLLNTGGAKSTVASDGTGVGSS